MHWFAIVRIIFMAISLIASPLALALTRGGSLFYRFQGNGRTLVVGTAATNGIVVSGPLVAGNTITLAWGDKQETLTIRQNPTEPGELPIGDGGSTYVDELADYLAQYQPIREHFTVSRDGLTGFETIVLTAKNTGSAYTVRQISTAGNWIASSAIAGQDALIRERYSIYVELHVARPGLDGSDPAHFDTIYTGYLETDLDGYADFDCGAMLHNQLTADLPYFQSAIAHVDTLSVRPYYVSYGEAWGSPIKAGRVTDGPTKRAYLGGADYINRAGDGFSLTQLGGIQPSVSRALRFGPRRRYVRLNEPNYLTFVNFHSNVASIGLKVQLVLDDDQVIEKTDLVEEVAFPAGAKVTFPVSFTALGLDSYVPAGNYLKQYVVRLHHSGTDYSVDYTFTIDYAYRPYTRYFVFLNSLGAFDSLTTYGKGSAELQRMSELAELSLAPAYEITDGQFVEYDIQLQQQYEVSTGFRSEAQLRRWQDFYRSPLKFLLKPSREVLPIGILSKSIKQGKDSDNLFAHTFSFQFLYTDMFFTDDDEFDENPPPGFSGAGTITVEQTTVVAAVDTTVPAAARQITADDLALLRQLPTLSAAVSAKLSPGAADLLYPRKEAALTLDQANDAFLSKDAISPTAPLEVGGLLAPLDAVDSGDGLAVVTTPDPQEPAKKELKYVLLENLVDMLSEVLGLNNFIKKEDAEEFLTKSFDTLSEQFGINEVLENDNEALLELMLRKGLTVIGNTEEAKLFEHLSPAPDKGEFLIRVSELRTNQQFNMPWSRAKALMNGTTTPVPVDDPGAPVAPIYEPRTYSSGVDINFTFGEFTTAGGLAYPVPITYKLSADAPSWLTMSTSRNVSGKTSVDADTTYTFDLIGEVTTGKYIGVKVTRQQKITILAKPAPPAQKPIIAELANVQVDQNQPLTIQPSVSSLKPGTWSAVYLPAGMSINPQTGTITGTPLNSGSYPVNVTFTDSDGQSDDEAFLLTVTAAPVTNWFLAGGYTTDVNTKALNLFWSLASGVTALQFGVECLDGTILTGKTRSGQAWTTDPTASTGFWQNAFAENNSNGAFNWANSYYPQAFNPVVAGLVPGKNLKVRLRRFAGDTEVVRYVEFPAAPNIDQVRALLASSPGAGGTGGSSGNQIPVFASIPNQVAYVGVPFRLEIPYAVDPDGGIPTHSWGGFPTAIYTMTNDENNQKFIFTGTPQYAGTFNIVGSATDGSGGQGATVILINQQPAPAGIAKVDGRFFAGNVSNNAISQVLNGGWLCHFIRAKGISLPSGAVLQVGTALYGANGFDPNDITWTNMVARTDGEFTHAEAHYLGVAYPGNFADYYIRVIQPSGSQVITGTGGGGISSGTSSTGTVIVQPIKLYTRDYGSNADTGTLLLYPASSTDNEIIISTWTD